MPSQSKNRKAKINDVFNASSLFDGSFGTITFREKKYEVKLKGIPECTNACPAGVNVKAYINLIANRRFEEAVDIIREQNPFPAVCGRVCTRPCEENCELGSVGDAVSIRALKRYASDYELARRPLESTPCELHYPEKIAIVGAGPAGLTAAVDLIRLGYPVTVYEKEAEPGGMLRYAIPPYRLPDRILEREIDWIQNLGITIKKGHQITDPASLFKKGYAAVLIAGGAPKSFPLDIPGDKAKGIIDALQFLKDINEENTIDLHGKTIVVIGGGSTAFDAARSARRLGAKKVILAYRRNIEEMPADHEEIEAAKLEGIIILTLAQPKKIIHNNNQVQGIELLKTRLGKPDQSGRGRPEPIENSEFIQSADLIIPAVGAMPNIGPIKGMKVTTPNGVVDVKGYGKTIIPGVFAAGDVEMGPTSAVEAIGRGHQAAKGIHAFLRGSTVSEPDQIINMIQISLESKSPSTKHYRPKKTIPEDISSFEEVEQGYTDFEAVAEASRCLSCGPCYVCPTCLPNCHNKQLVAIMGKHTFLIKAPPELSLEITTKGPATFTIKTDGAEKTITFLSLTAQVDKELCFGCGRCEEVCAYRAIKNMITKDHRSYAEVGHDACASCSACVSECPAGAISQGYMSDTDILSRLDHKKTDYPGVKGLMIFWNTSSPRFNTYKGVVELMSPGKLSPLFLIRALCHSGRGLLVIKPDRINGSHYLPWDEDPDEIIQRTWDLLRSIGISQKRIQYVDLPRDTNLTIPLKEFSHQLDVHKLSNIDIPPPSSIKSPLGKTLAILKMMSTQPDFTPEDDIVAVPTAKKADIAFFEGCLPILNSIGEAQKLYSLRHTRLAMYSLLKRLYPTIGNIPSFNCPSANLNRMKHPPRTSSLTSISQKNKALYTQLQPKKLIIGTPESYTTLSQDKTYDHIYILPEEIHHKLSAQYKLHPIHKTIYLHNACQLDTDPFYKATKKLLQKIPGIQLVKIEGTCGQTQFEHINSEAKQHAITLLNQAAAQGADLVICTSPYCEAHMKLCQREGSWRTVDIDIGDIYQLLFASLEGTE